MNRNDVLTRQVLLYKISDPRLNAFLKQHQIRFQFLADEDLSRQIQSLCGGAETSSLPPLPNVSAPVPDTSLMVFCGIASEQMDLILGFLRAESIWARLKAVVTPVNQTWTVRYLIGELEKEHQMFSEARKNASKKKK